MALVLPPLAGAGPVRVASALAVPWDEVIPLFLTLLLGSLALFPAFLLLERRLDDDGDDPPLGSVPGVDHDPEREAVTLPDGTVLDREEAAAVGAVYDYLGRRPGATREEIARACFSDHPAGFEEFDQWWERLVDPAVTALAEANLDEEPDQAAGVATGEE